MEIPIDYINQVKGRSLLRYYLGGIARLKLYIKYSFRRWVAQKKGAVIGKNTNLAWNIAKSANSNLVIGCDCCIEALHFDLRGGKIIIGDHVVINKDVSILRVSHYIDDNEKFTTRYYPDLTIGSYSWIATGSKILPQVTKIGEGAILGAYSVISKNCEADGIYVGNPAQLTRKHNTRFNNIVVASLQGGDLATYILARKL